MRQHKICWFLLNRQYVWIIDYTLIPASRHIVFIMSRHWISHDFTILHGNHGRLSQSKWFFFADAEFVVMPLILVACGWVSAECWRIGNARGWHFLHSNEVHGIFSFVHLLVGTNVKSIEDAKCDIFGMKCWIIVDVAFVFGFFSFISLLMFFKTIFILTFTFISDGESSKKKYSKLFRIR